MIETWVFLLGIFATALICFVGGFALGLYQVLSLIDGSQTYKVTSDEEDTYIDKQVLRETVEVLRKEGEK